MNHAPSIAINERKLTSGGGFGAVVEVGNLRNVAFGVGLHNRDFARAV